MDVAIANEEDVQKSLGILTAVGVTVSQLDRERYRTSEDRVLCESPSLRLIAVTLRGGVNADIDGQPTYLNNGSKFYTFGQYEIRDIADRVSGGDSLAADLIYGLIHYQSHQETLELAVATSYLKHSILGNFNRVDVVDTEKLMAGDGSGRVQR